MAINPFDLARQLGGVAIGGGDSKSADPVELARQLGAVVVPKDVVQEPVQAPVKKQAPSAFPVGMFSSPIGFGTGAASMIANTRLEKVAPSLSAVVREIPSKAKAAFLLGGADSLPESTSQLPPGMTFEELASMRMTPQDFWRSQGINSDEDLRRYKASKQKELKRDIEGSNKRIAAATPDDLNIVERGIVGGGASLATNALGVTASVATRSPGVGLAFAGAVTGLDSYGEARVEGASPQKAAAKASIDAAIEVTFEKYGTQPLADILRKTGISKAAEPDEIKNALLKFAAREIPAEQATTAAQTLNDIAFGLDQEMENAQSLGEMARIQGERQAVTLVSTVLAGGVQAGGISAVEGAARTVQMRKLEGSIRELESRSFANEQERLEAYRSAVLKQATDIAAPAPRELRSEGGQPVSPEQYGKTYAGKVYGAVGNFIPGNTQFSVEKKEADGKTEFMVKDQSGRQYGQVFENDSNANSFADGLNELSRARADGIKALEPLSASLRETLTGLGLNDIGLSLGNKVFNREGEMLTSEGMYDPMVRRVFLAVDAIDPTGTLDTEQRRQALRGVLRHETVHALRNLDLWKNSEWKNLERAASTLRRPDNGKTYLENAQELYSDQNAVIQVEEAVAELIRDVADRLPGIGGKPRTLSERAINFFDKTKNAMSGAGFQTYEDVVRKFESGQVGSRQRDRIRTYRATEEYLASRPQNPVLPERIKSLLSTPQGRQEWRQDAVQSVMDKAEVDAAANPAAANASSINGLRESRSAIELVPQTIEVNGREFPTRDSKGLLIYSGYEGEEVFGLPTRPTLEGLQRFWEFAGDSKIVDYAGRPLVYMHGTSADIVAFKPKQAASVFMARPPKFAEEFAYLSQNYMVGNFPDFVPEAQVLDALNESLQSGGGFTPRSYDALTKARDMAAEDISQGKGIRPAALKVIKEEAKKGASSVYLNSIMKRLPSGPNLMPVYINAKKPWDYDNRQHVDAVVKQARENGADVTGTMVQEIREGNWQTIEGSGDNAPILDAIRELGFDAMYVEEAGYKNLAVFDPAQIKSAIGNNGDFSPLTPSIRESRVRNPQIDTPEFKEFFRDSKVVDGSLTRDGFGTGGDPLVVYHATNADIKAFRVGTQGGALGNGIYFSPSTSYVEKYAGAEGGNIIPAYVSIQNPLVIDFSIHPDPMVEALIRLGVKESSAERTVERAYDTKGYITNQVKKRAEDAGFDGIIQYRENGRMNEVVAFYPTQVKSAIGNAGTFNRYSPDIRESRKGKPEVFYHGSKSGQPQVFDPTAGLTAGSWFTKNRAEAERFGDVGAYTVDVKSPASMQDFAQARREVVASGIDINERPQEFNAAVIKNLEEKGFDGIRDKAFAGAGGVGEDVVAAFRPEQIKPESGKMSVDTQSNIERAIYEADRAEGQTGRAAETLAERAGAVAFREARPAKSSVRPGTGRQRREQEVSSGNARQPVNIRPIQDGASTYAGVHYGSVADLAKLSGAKYGTGIRGAEAARLRDSRDARIKRRVYFYINKAGMSEPIRPEAGVGGNVYTQVFNNILGPGERMYEISKQAKNDNDFESLVIKNGFDGYAAPSMGMIILLGIDAPVRYEGNVGALRAKGEYDYRQMTALAARESRVKAPAYTEGRTDEAVPEDARRGVEAGRSVAPFRESRPESERAGVRGGRGEGGGIAPLEGAPDVRGGGPIPEIVGIAERYAEESGIPYQRQPSYVEVDEARATRIAEAFEAMRHDPKNPEVLAAYRDMIRQTRAQYNALVDAGYEFTFFDGNTDPYNGNPWNAMRDLRDNKSMAVYGTYDGYGTSGITDSEIENNPMLEDTGIRWPDQSGVSRMVTANDLFRAVHDAFGHGVEGAGFRARGEENAWQAHARLFNGPALAALTSETRGQNSWLNFNPKPFREVVGDDKAKELHPDNWETITAGEHNRTAQLFDTVFAENKIGMMPEWTWQEGLDVPKPRESKARMSVGQGTPIGPTQPGPSTNTSNTAASGALNNGQPTNSIGIPVGPTITSTAPDGTVSIQDVRVPPIMSRLLLGIVESSTDKLRRGVGLDDLADRVERYYNGYSARLGLVNGIIRDAMKKIGFREKEQAMTTFEQYMRERENGRATDAQYIYDNATEAGRALIDAWNQIAVETGRINTSLVTRDGKPLRVFDSQAGAWRKIGMVKDFFPRTFSQEVMQVMKNPDTDPVLYNQLLDALVSGGFAADRDEAKDYILREWFSDEVKQDYFAGVEKGRTDPLPEIFYDYSWDAAVRYMNKWARRTSQVEQFGQEISQFDKDWFDTNIPKVRDDRTQAYLNDIKKIIYENEQFDVFNNIMSWLNSIATGAQLGNPVSAFLNLVGGTVSSAQEFGIKEVSKAYLELVRDWKNVQKTGTTLGILNTDVMRILSDHVERESDKYFSQEQKVSMALAKFANVMLTFGGYNGAENIVRAMTLMAAQGRLNSFVRDASANPTSKNVRNFMEWAKRQRIDTDALLIEDGQGPETERYLRRAVNVPQGSYKIDMTPVFVDQPMGRFLFKYQKFGTQMNRFFYQNFLKPFADNPSPRNFFRIISFLGTAVIGGTAILALREALGYGDPGPDEEELKKALENKDTARFYSMMFSRAWQNIMAAGSFGFFGNYAQLAYDWQDQQRVKNPLSPPGLSSVNGILDIGNRIIDQGKFTARDLDEVMEANLSAYRAGRRMTLAAADGFGSDAREVRRFAAMRDQREIDEYTRRYASAMDIEFKRRTAPGAVVRTPMTQTNKTITDALRQGEHARARALIRQATRAVPFNERERVERSIKASVRNRQPIRIGGSAPSAEQKQQFLKWARRNLPTEAYQKIVSADKMYSNAANRADVGFSGQN